MQNRLLQNISPKYICLDVHFAAVSVGNRLLINTDFGVNSDFPVFGPCGHCFGARFLKTFVPLSIKMMQKLPFVRILVVGAQEVGKTAVTVRFLTQRFIGEYDSQKDFVYSSTTPVTGFPVEVEIIDTSRDQTDNIPVEKLLESTAFVVVYSISSKSSFVIAADCARNLQSRGQPILLLANKRDLEHIREVTTEEGQQLAKELGGVYFAEVSAAESYPEVVDAFRTVISDACAKSNVNSSPTNTTSRRKKSVVSVSKIISAMFGRSSSGIVSDSHNQKKRPSLSL